MSNCADESALLTTDEVARLFRVDPQTVTRWAKAQRLACVYTPGGHRRFRRADVDARLHPSEAGQ